MSSTGQSPTIERLEGTRIGFVGRLAGMSRREAKRLLREQSAIPVDPPDRTVDVVVIGESAPWAREAGSWIDRLSPPLRQAAQRGALKVVSETQLWQRLGLVDIQQHVQRLYTPAMLAELLDVPVGMIRRWHRKGLLVPSRQVQRLPYFDFQEVAVARQLAELLRAGCSPRAIERKMVELAELFPHIPRPLTELSVLIEGKQLLVRQENGLAEPGGQLRLDFSVAEAEVSPVAADTAPQGGKGVARSAGAPRADAVEDARRAEMEAGDRPSPDELVALSFECDSLGQFDQAAQYLRSALAAAGPDPELNFLLADLLYRMGELAAARERYFMAIELDENYVEARTNLGCVLGEMGEHELAKSAFLGALAFHDYPDAHYHLARVCDKLSEGDQAEIHWRAFLEKVPDSPWADEARHRLGLEE